MEGRISIYPAGTEVFLSGVAITIALLWLILLPLGGKESVKPQVKGIQRSNLEVRGTGSGPSDDTGETLQDPLKVQHGPSGTGSLQGNSSSSSLQPVEGQQGQQGQGLQR